MFFSLNEVSTRLVALYVPITLPYCSILFRFKSRAECIISQYGKYTVEGPRGKVPVNGVITQVLNSVPTKLTPPHRERILETMGGSYWPTQPTVGLQCSAVGKYTGHLP